MPSATDIHEVDPGCHLLRQTGVQGAGLGVDIGEEGETGPAADLHNGRVAHALEFERHGARRTQ